MNENDLGYRLYGKSLQGIEIPAFSTTTKWMGDHLQTMRNSILGPTMSLPDKGMRVHFDIAGGQKLAASFHPSTADQGKPLILMVHGLTGSETSAGFIAACAYFIEQGFPVMRLNLRGAGPSAESSTGPFHAGLSEDLRAVIDQIPAPYQSQGIVIYGVSLGGNMALKYMGEQGDDTIVRAVVTVSAPVDLKSSQACLSHTKNAMYHVYLLDGMKKEARFAAKHHSDELNNAAEKAKTIYDFDNDYVCPIFGFQDAEEYYKLNSSAAYLQKITKPTLMIHAENDPWIPVDDILAQNFPEEGPLSLLVSNDGGHAGFHAKELPISWADYMAVEYFNRILD